MLSNRSAKSPAPASSLDLGRGQWLMLGAGAMAVGAALHAIAGLVDIVKEILRARPTA